MRPVRIYAGLEAVSEQVSQLLSGTVAGRDAEGTLYAAFFLGGGHNKGILRGLLHRPQYLPTSF